MHAGREEGGEVTHYFAGVCTYGFLENLKFSTFIGLSNEIILSVFSAGGDTPFFRFHSLM